jgi:hypothetical protein
MKKTISTLFVSLALLMLYGCSALFQPPEQEPAAPGMGRVAVSIGGGAASARTFFPAALSSPGYAHLTFSASGKDAIDPIIITTATTVQELEEGTWTLDVKVYLEQNDIGNPAKVVSTGTETITVIPGGVTSVQVDLVPVQTGTGKGTLNYTITLPSTAPTSAGLTIEKISGEAADPVIKNLLEDGSGSVSLPPGTYRLTVKLSDGAGKYARWTGIAQIYQNLETAASCVFGDDPFTDSFFTDLAALSSWLDAADANTGSDPYPISLALEDLAPLAGTGGGLHGIFEALHGRYVSLDLSESAATAIPAAAGTYTAHAGGDKITSIILPSGLATIGDYGLAGLSAVSSLTLPAGVTDIGRAAFAGSGIAQFAVDESGSFTTDGPRLLNGATLVAYPSATGKITLDGITTIGPGAFAGSALTYITIPAELTSIGEGAFEGCSALQTIKVLSETPPALGAGAFAGAHTGLAIIVPTGKGQDYKTAQGWADYSACIQEALAPFTSLADLTAYLASAAGGTDKTNPIEVALAMNLADFAHETYDDAMRNLFGALSVSKYVSVDLSECTGAFKTSVSTLSSAAKTNRQWLAAITLPAHITEIPVNMVRECVNLVTVDLSKCSLLTALPNDMFRLDSSLAAIDLSGCASLTTIGNYTFQQCSSIKEITLPPTVTTVGSQAFNGSSLKWFKCPVTQTNLDIKVGAFASCPLERVELPVSFSVPSTAAQNPFVGSGNKKVMVFHGSTPPAVSFLNYLAWADSYSIYVPGSAVEAYKAAEGWSSLKDNIKSFDDLTTESPDHPDNW